MNKENRIVVYPIPLEEAFPNPLKGFRPNLNSPGHEYATLERFYIKWNEIENEAGDSVDKVREFCDDAWRGLGKRNVKVIPRVHLEWPGRGTYWPADMQQGDYGSLSFQRRLQALIRKLGEAWDGDPRVAYVEMGLIGLWGEHHSPSISPEVEKVLGDAFTSSFREKKVLVRHPWDFRTYSFGIYWDSFAHYDQEGHENGLIALGDRWKQAVMGGEVAYDWGNYRIQPGDDPCDSLADPLHLRYIADRVRFCHTNHLGWISDYDPSKHAVKDGAAQLQKTMGYRFELIRFEYTGAAEPGGSLEVGLEVTNTGSSPFYYDWPVEISILHAVTKQVIWKERLITADIRSWLPGDMWNAHEQTYMRSAPSVIMNEQFLLPADMPQGKHLIAISVLDPASGKPSLRFATKHYTAGGRHPLGYIGIGEALDSHESDVFDDLNEDRTLSYD